MLFRLLLLLLLINSIDDAIGQQNTVAVKGLKQTTKGKSADYPPSYGVKIVTPAKDLGYLIPPLSFPTDTLTYTPASFYFHSVIDSTDADSVGYGILPKDYKRKTMTTAGKKEILLLKYLRSITKTDSSLYPLVMVLKKMNISETQINKADLNAKIELNINIYALINNELFFLDDVGGTLESEVYVGFKREYGKIISYSLKQITGRLENMMQQAKPYLEGMEKGTALTATIKPHTESNNDTLYINNNFSLAWSDYHGKPISDKGFNPSLRLDIHIVDEIINDKLVLTVVIKPNFVRSRSWAGKLVQSETLLRHEYYKTQLIYLYALRLKKQLTETHFPLKGIKDSIYALYGQLSDTIEEELQKYAYDTESGTLKAKQEAWEKLITGQIEELKNYNSFFDK